jgi:membrane protein DedA with SNARE-associated domain
LPDIALSPTVVLSAILAALYGCAFHFWLGRTLYELALYIAASGLGFALGQIVGDRTGGDWLMLGQIHLLEATIGAIVLLLLARWLRARSA